MSTVPALASRLDDKKHAISDLEPEWVLFVKDHRQQVLDHSSVRYLTSDESYMYRYRLNDFLIDSGLSGEIQWIIQWINGLKTEVDFVDITSLILPEPSYISTLFQQFRSFNTKLKSSII